MRTSILAIIVALGFSVLAAPVASADESENLQCVHYLVTKYYKPDKPLRIKNGRVYGSVSKWTIWFTFEVKAGETCEVGKANFTNTNYHVDIVNKRYGWRDNGQRGRFERVLLDKSYKLCPLERNVYEEPRSTPCST